MGRGLAIVIFETPYVCLTLQMFSSMHISKKYFFKISNMDVFYDFFYNYHILVAKQ